MSALPALSDLFTNASFRSFEYRAKSGKVKHLNSKTLSGLEKANFEFMTKVQSEMIPRALQGENLLVQAVTGSGKTLGFVIPVIEKLVSLGYDGNLPTVGALIVLPTRELAIQVWDVVRMVGTHQTLSGGCLVGGKFFREEQSRINGQNMNICIGTPGRVVQHMEETPGFDLGSCEVLVVDEVDRLMDKGFLPQLKMILNDHGGRKGKRQLILCSATAHITEEQMKKLKIHKLPFHRVELGNEGLTSTSASQSAGRLRLWVSVVPLKHKINALMSFLYLHSKEKVLIFTETCKMILSELIRRLLPSSKVFEFHGKKSMTKRLDGFGEFSLADGSSIMVSTDLAERGVDIPNLEWVVQYDVPCNTETYVHRIGRTARLNATGDALLFCTPQEKPFVKSLVAETGFKMRLYRLKNSKDYRLVTPMAQSIARIEEDYRVKVDKAMISLLKSPLGPRYYSKSSIQEAALSYGLDGPVSYIPNTIKD